MVGAPLSVCVQVVLVAVCWTLGSGEPRVTAPAGVFLGTEKSVTFGGTEYKLDRYLGIPFAEPPVGERRFKKPVGKARLTEPYNATQFGPACEQVTGMPDWVLTEVMSEDCLYLNVYVPSGNTSSKPQQGYSVMIWIYGGSFTSGEGRIYHPDTLSAYGDVIVVNFNYRLAVMGFFSTGDENAAGNYGLWDQHQAIRWVHENIASFGGNPNSVTVFGESAGSISAMLQASYPGNKGLFQRVIGESGTPSALVAYLDDPLPTARIIAEEMGCYNARSINSAGLVSCLRQNTSAEILAMLTTLYQQNPEKYNTLVLSPTADFDFIILHPRDLNKLLDGYFPTVREVFSSIDLLTGVNSHEGAMFISPNNGIADVENFQVSRQTMNAAVQFFLSAMYNGRPFPDVIVDLALAEYTDRQKPDDPIALRDIYVQFIGDLFFVIPTLQYIKAHAALNGPGSTYLYQFTAKPSKHFINTPSWLNGATHTDEMLYVFGLDPDLLRDINFPGANVMTPEPWEYTLAQIMMSAWTNFAKTGNPNTPLNMTSLSNITWPEYTNQSQEYLKFERGMSSESTKSHLAARADNLWLTIVPKIENLCSQTTGITSSASTIFGTYLLPIFFSVFALLYFKG